MKCKYVVLILIAIKLYACTNSINNVDNKTDTTVQNSSKIANRRAIDNNNNLLLKPKIMIDTAIDSNNITITWWRHKYTTPEVSDDEYIILRYKTVNSVSFDTIHSGCDRSYDASELESDCKSIRIYENKTLSEPIPIFKVSENIYICTLPMYMGNANLFGISISENKTAEWFCFRKRKYECNLVGGFFYYDKSNNRLIRKSTPYYNEKKGYSEIYVPKYRVVSDGFKLVKEFNINVDDVYGEKYSLLSDDELEQVLIKLFKIVGK